MSNLILDLLYESQFQKQSSSKAVTSSHWLKFDQYQVSKNKSGHYELDGYGFGDFEDSTPLNIIKRFIPMQLSQQLFRKHRGNALFLHYGAQIAKNTKRIFNYDCIRQILSIQSVLNKIPILDIQTICVIGDGYGYTGSLFKEILPSTQVIFVNLGKTLFFDVFYVQKNFHDKKSMLLKNAHDYDPTCDFIFIEAENYQLIADLKIDLFFNSASFQEMNNEVINRYFEYIYASKASKKYFYCCNRIEKQLPDGTVTKIDLYPWRGSYLFNELCEWYQAYPVTIPPFWRAFNGPIKHILNIYE